MTRAGIVRRIDDLGRVVIPKEIRRTLRIREADPLEIYTDKEGEIILKKFSPIAELRDLANQYAESLAQTTGEVAVISDRDELIAVSGMPKKEMLNKSISKELEVLMNARKSVAAVKGDKEFVTIGKDMEEFEQQVIYPIISEGDIIGCVMLLSKEKKELFGTAERKLVMAAADFLGRHMEH